MIQCAFIIIDTGYGIVEFIELQSQMRQWHIDISDNHANGKKNTRNLSSHILCATHPTKSDTNIYLISWNIMSSNHCILSSPVNLHLIQNFAYTQKDEAVQYNCKI